LFIAVILFGFSIVGLRAETAEQTAARARVPFGENANNPATHFVVRMQGENALIQQTDPQNPRIEFKTTPPNAEAKKNEDNSKKTFWFWLLLALTVLIGVALYLYLNSRDHGQNSGSTPSNDDGCTNHGNHYGWGNGNGHGHAYGHCQD
jgi:hypothetical protein